MMVGRCRRDIVDSHWLHRDRLSSKCGFATLLDPQGGRPASAGLGALKTVAKP
jgi:hypothetical protein